MKTPREKCIGFAKKLYLDFGLFTLSQTEVERIAMMVCDFTGNEVGEATQALRRQVAELVAACEAVLAWWGRVYPPDIFDGSSGDENALEIVRIRNMVCAALARCGGECETCEYSQLNPDGGHCYMFKEKPARRCAQWRQARGGGGGEEVME